MLDRAERMQRQFFTHAAAAWEPPVDVLESDSFAAGLAPVVLHEIGHALGIGGHSAVDTDAMYAFPVVWSPSRRDALTLRYVLHRRPDLTL